MATGDKKSNLDKWLALKKKSGKIAKPQPIEKIADGSVARLSHGQERLWLLQQLYPENPFYNYAHRYRLSGTLKEEQLIASFQAIAEQHELVQIAFEDREGELVQTLHPERILEVPTLDLSALAAAEQTEKLAQVTDDFLHTRFDLSKDVLLKLLLVKLSDTEHQLLLLLHHIIGDRGSLQLLNEAVASHYRLALTGEAFSANSQQIQYRDYAHWQRQQTPKNADLDYWLQQLGGTLPVLELPTDYPRPAQADFVGQTIHQALDPSLVAPLRVLAKEQNTTLFSLGLAAFQLLLYRYTGQTDLLVGAPVSNRDREELQSLIGFFNETLVFRSDLSGELTFRELLQQVQQTTLDAFAHRSTPFELLVQKLKPSRQGTSNPVFQAMFVFNEAGNPPHLGEGLQVQEESIDLGITKFDLTLFLQDFGRELGLSIEFDSELFAVGRMERLLGHLEILLKGIASNPDQSIHHYRLLPEAEQQQILVDWNATASPAPTVETILDHFQQQLVLQPDHPAVAFGATNLSYADLDARANAVAQALLAEGELKNCLVGLLTKPSVELLVGILGILKAGAAYLPLDPNYPASRIQYMLEDAEVNWVLTQRDQQELLASTQVNSLILEDLMMREGCTLPTVEIRPEDLAYMIYTSGSTGQPKGVPISHQNLLHSTEARFHFYNEQPGVFLLLSSFSFDSSVAGVFWAMASGGTLVLAPKGIEQNIDQLAGIIAKQKVTHSLMLPSLYSVLLEFAKAEQLQSLRIIMVAGEACYPSLLEQHLALVPQAKLYNEYGPTEATVWSTAHELSTKDLGNRIPIGRPIPYASNYILDSQLQTVPAGVIGELYIGGPSVARGYWQRPELTAERFLPNPFGEGRLYRTGDRVRFRANGQIDFLGRVDHQVKIRGHRVELGEIKRLLLQIPLVKDAVVILNDKQLLATYLLVEEGLELAGAKYWLSTQLPDYMVPLSWAVLSDYPRLPNGKIDQVALAESSGNGIEAATDSMPASELETQLLAIWKSVLKTDQVSVLDNFFELGGDSLKSIRLIAKAQKEGITIAPNHLFEQQNIRALATFLQGPKTEADSWSSVAKLQESEQGKPLFCIHSGAGHVFFYRQLAQHLGDGYNVYALQPKGLDGKMEQNESIEEMAAFYLEEIKKVQAHGPYRILGTCFSNAVGLEMAQQLKTAGEEIERLIFVDSAPAHLQSLRQAEGKRTAHRFSKMLKSGDWKSIRRKLRNRLIVAGQKLSSPFKDKQAQRLQDTIDNLNKLYALYNWTPFDGDIMLIRSSEFAARSDKDYHLEQWSELAEKELTVYEVPGHHLTLFEEPEVAGLAEVLKEVL